MIENWAKIKDYPSYEISDRGRIKRVVMDYRGRVGILSPVYSKGYKRIMLYPTRKMFFVHRLVMESFASNPLNRKQINHKNGIKYDNRLVNLEYCTSKENITHAEKIGLRNSKGESNNKAKLTEKDVGKIRKEYNRKEGVTCKYLAKKYKVSPSNIQYIIKRKIWKTKIINVCQKPQKQKK